MRLKDSLDNFGILFTEDFHIVDGMKSVPNYKAKLYHGSSKPIGKFDVKSGGGRYGSGLYLTPDLEIAKFYSGGGRQGNAGQKVTESKYIYEFEIQGNALVITDEESFMREMVSEDEEAEASFQYTGEVTNARVTRNTSRYAQEQGFDIVVMEEVGSVLSPFKQVIVMNPKAIKSQKPVQAIGEKFDRAVQTSGGKQVEVFKNPSRKEVKDVTDHDEVRAFLVGNDLYVWSAVGAIHHHMAEQLKVPREAIALNLGVHSDGKSYWANVSDWNRGGPWFHNPEIRDQILSNPALKLVRDRQEFAVQYYDEDIVGDWSEITDESMEEAKEISAPEDLLSYIRGDDSIPDLKSLKKYQQLIMPQLKKLYSSGMARLYRGDLWPSDPKGEYGIEEIFNDPTALVSFTESKSTAIGIAKQRMEDGDGQYGMAIEIYVPISVIYFHWKLDPVGREHPKEKEVLILPYGNEWEVIKTFKPSNEDMSGTFDPLGEVKKTKKESWEIVDYAMEQHGREDWEDTDIGERIEQYSQYELKNVNPNDLDLENFEIDWEYASQLTKHDIKSNPIIVDMHDGVIDGNHRAEQALKLGLLSIPAWVAVK